ncbi:MAG: hypothetical protein KI790_13665 [Cyclobacteriaceae bacterium]|nr:hypothetical protein [Cyclobacteriaceae bacterium HetDA_MAG_MS6]
MKTILKTKSRKVKMADDLKVLAFGLGAGLAKIGGIIASFLVCAYLIQEFMQLILS